MVKKHTEEFCHGCHEYIDEGMSILQHERDCPSMRWSCPNSPCVFTCNVTNKDIITQHQASCGLSGPPQPELFHDSFVVLGEMKITFAAEEFFSTMAKIEDIKKINLGDHIV